MKRSVPILAVFVCLLVVGCAAAQDMGNTAAPQGQVENGQNSLGTQSEIPPTAGSESAQTPVAEESQVAGGDVVSYDIAGLEAAVDDIAGKIAAATESGDAAADRAVLLELHGELESVENQVDQMDDLIDADVRDGVITRSEHRALSRQLDALDDQLDRAEAALEFVFGVDD